MISIAKKVREFESPLNPIHPQFPETSENVIVWYIDFDLSIITIMPQVNRFLIVYIKIQITWGRINWAASGMSDWHNWLGHMSPVQEVVGSNPGQDTCLVWNSGKFCNPSFLRGQIKTR